MSSDLPGFTPILDVLVKKYSLITAAVYGRVWRYCQGEAGLCYASLEKIGQEIGVDRSTVMRHVRTLVADGYIEDLTPDLRNHPHIYRLTSKEIGVAECNTGVAESDTGMAQNNTGVAESHKKIQEIESKKESKRGEIPRGKPPGVPPPDTKEHLRIDKSPGGLILYQEFELARAGSKRKPITYYRSCQQQEAFQVVFQKLGGELRPLVKAAISRDRTSLAAMLAFLEKCVENRKNGSKPGGNGYRPPKQNNLHDVLSKRRANGNQG